MKEYYRAKMTVCEEGLVVRTETWHQVHETEHFAYCVHDHDRFRLGYYHTLMSMSKLQYLKERGVLVKRIHKVGSRFAFDTREKAVDHFLFRQRKRLHHLERDLKFVQHVVDNVKSIDDLERTRRSPNSLMVPRSWEMVNNSFRFD